MNEFQFQTLFYPGTYLSDEKLNHLTQEMRNVASLCFPETPDYQALTGKRKELSRAVITLARNKKGELKGFCSALVLEVESVGRILHTGLTCVHPSTRGKKLTHKLTGKLLLKYLVKESLFQETWVTNCACVLSSLGNVALYFEDIYPSPMGVEVPTITHLNIAKAIDENYREPIAINSTAVFNKNTFVFEGSVEGTLFAKDPDDQRFHHRNQQLTKYYQELLDFKRGDEVLQVGKVSLMTFPKYMIKRVIKNSKKSLNSMQEKLEGLAN
jgi:hypothetical protein